MTTTKMLFLAVLFAVGLLMAQSGRDQPGSANKADAKDSKGEVTVQGCLAVVTGSYVLMQTDPGNTYKLEEGSRTVKLGPHLGEQVEVTGWRSASLSTSSDALNIVGSPSSETLMVTSIRTLAGRCTQKEVTANPPADKIAGAQLEVSSAPQGADIEIDGHFVGSTTSTVGVAAGQHQLVVKKRGYKAWEKTIAVTSGQVRVHAALEPESK